ncbi:MAG: hypothetical protein MUF34_15635 [Polyangiaceae bacterium]|nr:hypothetical protein [Polyangiaceae bacterium]
MHDVHRRAPEVAQLVRRVQPEQRVDPTFGWCTSDAMRASSRKAPSISGVCAMCECICLTATSRSKPAAPRCRPTYTEPMPPTASLSNSS